MNGVKNQDIARLKKSAKTETDLEKLQRHFRDPEVIADEKVMMAEFAAVRKINF